MKSLLICNLHYRSVFKGINILRKYLFIDCGAWSSICRPSWRPTSSHDISESKVLIVTLEAFFIIIWTHLRPRCNDLKNAKLLLGNFRLSIFWYVLMYGGVNPLVNIDNFQLFKLMIYLTILILFIFITLRVSQVVFPLFLAHRGCFRGMIN
jgi:hypothetical protein